MLQGVTKWQSHLPGAIYVVDMQTVSATPNQREKWPVTTKYALAATGLLAGSRLNCIRFSTHPDIYQDDLI